MWSADASEYQQAPKDFKFKSVLNSTDGAEIKFDLMNYGSKIYLHINKRTANGKCSQISLRDTEFFDMLSFFNDKMSKELKKMEKLVVAKYGLVAKEDLFEKEKDQDTYVVSQSKQTVKREKKRLKAINRKKVELINQKRELDKELTSSDDDNEDSAESDQEVGQENEDSTPERKKPKQK